MSVERKKPAVLWCGDVEAVRYRIVLDARGSVVCEYRQQQDALGADVWRRVARRDEADLLRRAVLELAVAFAWVRQETGDVEKGET